jgi:hypothetical protein
MRKTLLLFAFFTYSIITNAQHNVILIIADDISPDYFSFYPEHGDTVYAPHIQSLLNDGILFTNAMAVQEF